MKIQFCHSRKEILSVPYFQSSTLPRGGETIAMEFLESWFVKELKVGNFFTKLVGKARCSDEDNYNKKIGRELAVSRMKKTVLTVTGIESEVIVLQDTDKNIYVLKGTHFVGYNE